MTTLLLDDHRKAVKLGPRIGGGGEADVFAVGAAQGTNLLAKVWKPSVQYVATSRAKVQFMVGKCPASIATRVAWPLSTLRDSPSGEVKGFLMQNFANARPLNDLMSIRYRNQHFPSINWSHLVTAAVNVASIFSICHKNGICIGDVSDANILITQQGSIRIIDCDSWQVQGQAKSFDASRVRTPEYTPPEIYANSSAIEHATVNHDNFALAVLIFKLLFQGRHPFYEPTGDLALAIKNHSTVLDNSKFDRLYFTGLTPLDAPQQLFTRFEHAFQTNARPTAGEWVQSLQSLSKSIRNCACNRHHAFSAHLTSCPWCEVDHELGPGFSFGQDASSTTSVTVPKLELDNLRRTMLQTTRIKPPKFFSQVCIQPCNPTPIRNGFFSTIRFWIGGIRSIKNQRERLLASAQNNFKQSLDRCKLISDMGENKLKNIQQDAEKSYLAVEAKVQQELKDFRNQDIRQLHGLSPVAYLQARTVESNLLLKTRRALDDVQKNASARLQALLTLASQTKKQLELELQSASESHRQASQRLAQAKADMEAVKAL